METAAFAELRCGALSSRAPVKVKIPKDGKQAAQLIHQLWPSVQLLGGRVGVESEQGSRFWVELRSEDMKRLPARAAQAPEAQKGGGLTTGGGAHDM